jgi:outer membrane immunogenic protein
MKHSLSSIFAMGAGVILASTIAASAADMPVNAPAYIQPAGYNWSGFYVGLNAGAAFGRAHDQTTNVLTPGGYFLATSIPVIASAGDQHTNKVGFTGGIQAGYNWQINNTVLGLETDFNYMGVKASTTSGAVYPCCAPTSFTINQSAKTDWLYTMRPRLGWATNNWLLYVSGGLAVTQIKGDFSFSDTNSAASESASISKTKAGWALGGGVEYGMAGPWSLKVEYLHVDFGSVATTSSNLMTVVGPFPMSVFTHSIKVSDDIVRLGLNYRFQ